MQHQGLTKIILLQLSKGCTLAEAVLGIAPYSYTHQQMMDSTVVLEAITKSAETSETVHPGS